MNRRCMRRRAALFAGILLALLATSCGGGIGPAEETEAEWRAYQEALEQQQMAEEALEASEEPDYPETFSLAWYSGRSLNPFQATDGVEKDISTLLYEPLFMLDSTFEPIPLLCESYAWDESGLQLTLVPRQDVAFQDGSPLTARDVSESLMLSKASTRYAYRLRNMISATANRDGTVTVTLSAPNQRFLALLDIPIIQQGTADQTVPGGTGPYTLVTGEENYLQASETWWQGKSRPIAKIPLVDAKDQDTAMYLFSSRRVEMLTIDPTSDREALSGQYDSTERPTAILQFIGFNTTTAVFSTSDARNAFSLGIPRDVLVDAQLAGHAVAAQFPVSPLSGLYPTDLDRPYNKEQTLEALRAAGQDTGEKKNLTLLVNEEDSFRLSSARFIAESLSLLDWEIQVTALPWDAYMEALVNGQFDLYYGEIKLTADWDLTDLIATGGSLNYGGFSNEALDVYLASFSSASNSTIAARTLYLSFQSNMPIAPICFRTDTVLTHPHVVEGLSPAPDNTFWGLEQWVIHTNEN